MTRTTLQEVHPPHPQGYLRRNYQQQLPLALFEKSLFHKLNLDVFISNHVHGLVKIWNVIKNVLDDF